MFSWLATLAVLFLHSSPAGVDSRTQHHFTGAGTTHSMQSNLSPVTARWDRRKRRRPPRLVPQRHKVVSLENAQCKAAQVLLRAGDLDGADRVVGTCLNQCRDQGSLAEIWSLRLIKASLLWSRGRAGEALDYLASREDLYPPEKNDILSLVGLKNHRG